MGPGADGRRRDRRTTAPRAGDGAQPAARALRHLRIQGHEAVGPRAEVVRVLATYGIKGGVGKTSAAVNFAYLAARDGARVLLWDLDPQASASYLLRVKPRIKGGGRRLVSGETDIDARIKATDYDNFDLLPGDLSYRHLDLILDEHKRPTRRLRRLLAPLADEFDVVVLDCPPGITLLSESIFEAADALLVPLIPSTLSMRTLDQLEDFLDGDVDRRPDVLAFFSMVDRRRRIHREVLEGGPRRRSVVLECSVPAASEVERMGVRRAPVGDFAPRSRAAVAYEALWQEIDGHLARRSGR